MTHRRLLMAAAALLIFSQGASAVDIKTFTFDWSGASFQNGATGHGSITFDWDIAVSNGYSGTNNFNSISQLDFSITGASPGQGNGDFTKPDFQGVNFVLNGSVDPTQDLVGQAGFADFNVIARTSTHAPTGADVITVETNNQLDGNSSLLLLTHFVQGSGNGGGAGGGGNPAVPEPATLGLFGIGVAAMRFSKRRPARG